MLLNAGAELGPTSFYHGVEKVTWPTPTAAVQPRQSHPGQRKSFLLVGRHMEMFVFVFL